MYLKKQFFYEFIMTMSGKVVLSIFLYFTCKTENIVFGSVKYDNDVPQNKMASS